MKYHQNNVQVTHQKSALAMKGMGWRDFFLINVGMGDQKRLSDVNGLWTRPIQNPAKGEIRTLQVFLVSSMKVIFTNEMVGKAVCLIISVSCLHDVGQI